MLHRNRKHTYLDPEVWDYEFRDGLYYICAYKGKPAPRIVVPNNSLTRLSSYFRLEGEGRNVTVIDFNNVPFENNEYLGGNSNFHHIVVQNVNKDLERAPYLYQHSLKIGQFEVPKKLKLSAGMFENSDVTSIRGKFKEGDGDDFLNFTFAYSSLYKAPDLGGLRTEKMLGTFQACPNLEEPCKNYPKGIKKLPQVYNGCSRLKSTGNIPDTVDSMMGTFAVCCFLKECTQLPKNLQRMNNTFAGCTNLTSVPEIPEGVVEMNSTFEGTGLHYGVKLPENVLSIPGIYQNCKNLKVGSYIPNKVVQASKAYSCSSVERVPNYGKSLVDASNMFQGCSHLLKVPDLEESIEVADFMFAGCTSLQRPPKLNKNLVSMSSMFQNCTSLLTFPIIPPKVRNMKGAFDGCVNADGSLIILSEVIQESLGSPDILLNHLYKLKEIYLPFNTVTHKTIVPYIYTMDGWCPYKTGFEFRPLTDLPEAYLDELYKEYS